MVYWVMGPIRGHSIVRGQVDVSVGLQDITWAKGSSLEVPGSVFEDKFHLDVIGQRSEGLACHQGQRFGQFY